MLGWRRQESGEDGRCTHDSRTRGLGANRVMGDLLCSLQLCILPKATPTTLGEHQRTPQIRRDVYCKRMIFLLFLSRLVL
jgi:hypothetical protein